MQREYTLSEVKTHCKPEDCWVVINELVYDVTQFLKLHPGGAAALKRVAGTDATEEFNALHSPVVARKYSHLVVGRLARGNGDSKDSGSGSRRSKERSVVNYTQIHDRLDKPFGCDIPFSEPYWYSGKLTSPYHNQSHAKWRAYVRRFVETELMPFASDWDEAGTYPPELHKKFAKAGLLYAVARYALKPHGHKYGKPSFGDTDLDFDEFDEFHDIILYDELARCGTGGVVAATVVSLAIAIPPILWVGTEEMRARVVPGLLNGDKIICLCITEPYVGSDVAAIRTQAVPTQDGSGFLISGEKKFITSGIKADYYVVAVRTGKQGVDGISLMLLEKGMPGLSARRLKTQGWLSSNTALVMMDNVKVPRESLIGEINKGFLPIMHQFNRERFMGIISVCRMMRMCIEDSVKFARQRKTFGRRLIDHQVIRHKIMDMGRMVETTYALLELLAFEMKRGVEPRLISGHIALLKAHATKCVEVCAREASQILGGASYLRHGIGERVERIYREVRVNAIGGGSEEVMIDLASKQSQL